jgi:PAS domain S-box-containing protein
MPVPEDPPGTVPATPDLSLPRGEVAFRLLVDAVQDYAIFLLSLDGHVLTWNSGAQRIKGYRADEIIGQHFSRFYTPQDRDAHRPTRLLGRAREHGRVEDEGWRIRKDGSRFWADVILTALRDEHGETYAFAKITRDLTERRAAEEQQRELLAEQRARTAAEEALAARDRFLTIASHELKTPVASVRLAAEGLVHARGAGRLDEARLEAGLARLITASQRLGVLVDELLDITRLTADTAPLVRVPTDLVAVAREVIGRFEQAPDLPRIELLAPERAEIPADASRIDQVLTNLIDNALKYSASGSRVEVGIDDAGDVVELSVSDRGIGLDDDGAARERIFEAFGRGDNAEHIPGLGLGLHISHQIVIRHGGTIDAERRGDGPGARFTVRLPRDAPQAADVGA